MAKKGGKQPLKVLIIEDNLICQKVANMFIEELGFEADIAADGETALSKYHQQPYALILTDFNLPDTNGIEITKKIREFEKQDSKHIPIVACTTSPEETIQQCINSGMDDVIQKPITLEKLSPVIAKYLRLN